MTPPDLSITGDISSDTTRQITHRLVLCTDIFRPIPIGNLFFQPRVGGSGEDIDL